MPKPNTDPLLEPQRKKKPAKSERGDEESAKADAPAVDTLLKGTPPPTRTHSKSSSGGPSR
jgi:hypothetical protein